MGSKAQRLNQHVTKIMRKIKRFEKKGWKTGGLKKELSYCMGETPRSAFKTGATADLRKNKSLRFTESSKKKEDKENNK